MTPYPKFEFQNKVLRAPSGMPDCEDLAAHHTSDGKRWISCWRPAWRERISILLFGKVWADVHSGFTAPPIALTGARRYLQAPTSLYVLHEEMTRLLGRVHWWRKPQTGARFVVCGDSRTSYRRICGRVFWRLGL